MIKDSDGSIKAYPIIDGEPFLREIYEKLKYDLYMCGKPDDLISELQEIFEDDNDGAPDCVSLLTK